MTNKPHSQEFYFDHDGQPQLIRTDKPKYSEERTIFVKVRQDEGKPIKTFETSDVISAKSGIQSTLIRDEEE